MYKGRGKDIYLSFVLLNKEKVWKQGGMCFGVWAENVDWCIG